MDMLKGTIRELKRALDVTYMRNRIISENIANAETPGYRARKIDFQKAITDAEGSAVTTLTRTNSQHLLPEHGEAGIKVEEVDTPPRGDGNNVDLEMEMVNLSENSITYNTASEVLNRKLKMLRFAITEGR